MIWALIVGAAILAAPFVVEAFRRPIDAARDEAPGLFADLPRGVTHYRWRGGAKGHVVVLVHGLTTPSEVWDGIAEGLADAGLRVLSYDLYGRGYSDRPPGRQDLDFFVGQLEALLDRLGLEEVTLFGYSMGGIIATDFAHRHPDRVRRLMLLAPAGMIHTPATLYWLSARLPAVGDWLMLAYFPRFARLGLKRFAKAPGRAAEIAAVQRRELRFRGYIPAVLSSLRGALMTWQHVEHNALGARGMPVLAIWGEADRTIPITAMGRLAEWNRKAHHASVPEAGHFIGVTHPEEVLRAVREEMAQAG